MVLSAENQRTCDYVMDTVPAWTSGLALLSRTRQDNHGKDLNRTAGLLDYPGMPRTRYAELQKRCWAVPFSHATWMAAKNVCEDNTGIS
jgi:hypothetical protein